MVIDEQRIDAVIIIAENEHSIEIKYPRAV
jgi:hypothetical protein